MTVSYQVLVNGEGLSSLLKDAEGRGFIYGCRVNRHAQTVSHLLSADDSFLFFPALNLKCTTINSILQDYACFSGQSVKLLIFINLSLDQMLMFICNMQYLASWESPYLWILAIIWAYLPLLVYLKKL